MVQIVAIDFNMQIIKSIIANEKELDELRLFLKCNSLPFSDLTLRDSYYILYRDEAQNIIGSIGLEFYGTSALLRSLAVDENHRGLGLGRELVKAILLESSNKIQAFYLLTETAYTFFLREGFVDVDRKSVPGLMKHSSEFTHTCPASEKCMVLKRT